MALEPFIIIGHIRKFFRMHYNIIRFSFFTRIAKRSIPSLQKMVYLSFAKARLLGFEELLKSAFFCLETVTVDLMKTRPKMKTHEVITFL